MRRPAHAGHPGDEHVALPADLSTRRLAVRAAEVVALLAVLGLVVALAPGLDRARDAFARADPGWLALGVLLEALSGASYVLMFRPVFCPRMSWRTGWGIRWVELGGGCLVPARGARGGARR